MKRFLYFFLLFPFFCSAQTNYKPGYLFENSGDSIPGFIDYKESDKNPSTIWFKSTVDGPAKVYKVEDCKGYGIDGIERYERFSVKKSMSTEELSKLSLGLDTSWTRVNVLLKVIQLGKKLSLYSYTDKIKTRFYLKEQDSAQPYELIHSIYRTGEGATTKEYKRYVLQLRAVTIKNNVPAGSTESKLRSLTYKKAPILGIVSGINEQKVEKEMKATRFFIGGGLNSSRASYIGTTDFRGPGVSEKTSFSPIITMGVDLLANPHIGRIVYRAELSFTTAKSEIVARNPDPSVDYKTHVFDSFSIIVTPQVIWNMINTEPFKIFVGGGAAINISKYNNNAITTKNKSSAELVIEKDKIHLNGIFPTPQVSAGMVVKKRTELFGNYMFNSVMTTYMNYNVRMVRYNFGVKYLLLNNLPVARHSTSF